VSWPETVRKASRPKKSLPKSIRQALGVTAGAKVAFDLRGDKVIVSRGADAQHEDPAIGAFLTLLEADIREGSHVGTVPDDLAAAMLANLEQPVDPDEEIEGDVAL